MKKSEGKKEEKKMEWINDKFLIQNVRNYEDKNVCFFNLYVKSVIGNVALYGCKIVSGKNGDFIAWPNQMGSDEKYHDVANIRLNDGEADAIIKAVSECI